MQDLLDKWGLKVDYNLLLSMWNESHRHYHTQNHLFDLIEKINKMKPDLTEKEYDKLILTSLFHDCIYDPMSNDNEERSADFFMKVATDKNNEDIQEINQMILDTKNHEPSSKLSEIFCELDMSIVQEDFNNLLKWEKGISEEYKGYGKFYKEGRIKFLKSLMDLYPSNSENLLKLIDWVKKNN